LASCSNKHQSDLNNLTTGELSFVPSLPDVPLPPGFEVDPTTGSFFDSAEGRIAEIYAAGVDKPKDVLDYYDKTLTKFGWVKESEMVFAKEGETLIITPEEGQYVNTIKYQLKPII